MHIEITAKPLDPWTAVQAFQQQAFPRAGRFGAMAMFVGTMRDFNEGDSVRGMTLEHYPGMTERHLQRIADEASRRFPLDDGLIIHRVGRIEPGDPIVVVAVWSAHRAAAFDGCRFIMEDLKARAPFWKKEMLDTGPRWVEKNTPG
jgi:molybdopterin synthase catalytic subunit